MNVFEQIFKNFRVSLPVAHAAVILRIFDFIYFRKEYSKGNNVLRLVISALAHYSFHFLFFTVYMVVRNEAPHYFMNDLYSGVIYSMSESILCLIATYLCGIVDGKFINSVEKLTDNYKKVKVNTLVNALTNVLYVIMFLGLVALYQNVLLCFEKTRNLAHYFSGAVIVPSIVLLLIVISVKRFIMADLFEDKKPHAIWLVLFSIGTAFIVSVSAFFLINISLNYLKTNLAIVW